MRVVDYSGLIGTRSGSLVALRLSGVIDGRWVMLCKCDCGNEYETPASKYRSGVRKSCGCSQHNKAVDMTGHRFGSAIVIGRAPAASTGNCVPAMWRCLCDCGAEFVRSGGVIRHCESDNSGCLRCGYSRRSKKHGMAGCPAHVRWKAMIQRCHNPRNPSYKNYGGRGIAVCARWRKSFERFYADMGDPPTRRHTLERINNDAGYKPSNCEWATKHTQSRNRRTNRFLTLNGRTQCVVDWARELGITPGALSDRIDGGWDVARALTAGNTKAAKLYTAQNRTMTIEDWSASTGISVDAIYQRLRRGWTIERAVSVPARPSGRWSKS
jgi:hypothetical protein